MRILLGILLMINVLFAKSDKVVLWECKFTHFSSPQGLKKDKLEIDFRLDLVTKKAYMESNNGISNVVPIQNKVFNAITFLEITGANMVYTTTITDDQAVHSRHSVFSDGIAPSQYYGKCSRK